MKFGIMMIMVAVLGIGSGISPARTKHPIRLTITVFAGAWLACTFREHILSRAVLNRNLLDRNLNINSTALGLFLGAGD